MNQAASSCIKTPKMLIVWTENVRDHFECVEPIVGPDETRLRKEGGV